MSLEVPPCYNLMRPFDVEYSILLAYSYIYFVK